MPTTVLMNAATAAAAAISVAVASFIGLDTTAYPEGEMRRLSQTEAASFAEAVFTRSDLNGDAFLDVNEFAALTIVTAELANLNGFIAIEKEAQLETIALPIAAPLALGDAEQTRIDAVARHTFYAFAGNDGKMQQGEYLEFQKAIFSSADLNANGALTSAELSIYAQRQAYLRPEA